MQTTCKTVNEHKVTLQFLANVDEREEVEGVGVNR